MREETFGFEKQFDLKVQTLTCKPVRSETLAKKKGGKKRDNG